jgi:site-specific recombinase XerD
MADSPTEKARVLTLDIKPRLREAIKPAELIQVSGHHELTLNARRAITILWHHAHSQGVSGQLDPSQVHRIVKQAAARAGLWLRHAHVSHALDRGAPAHLVQATVGHASLTTISRYAHARPKTSSSTYLPG